MKANETTIKRFLSSAETRFVIPVYQRNYDWSIGQCKQLLDDIVKVGSDKNTLAHFIGSIVYIHDGVYTVSTMNELTIIDGQQRLTTLTLVYFVLYKFAQNIKNESLANQISETYLINKFAEEGEKLKLRPSDNNDKALKYLMRDPANEEFGYSRIIDNFNYLKQRITKDTYEVVLAGLGKLVFVEISLDRQKDDPQRIFESLNSTGLELSQADLIRNYILMDLKREDQNKIYRDYWEIIERYAKNETLNESYVSDFIRDYLTVENKKIPNKGKVYLEFKEKYRFTTVAQLEEKLADIKSLVMHYNKIVNPKKEKDQEIELHLNYLNHLEVNVARPFLLKVYDDYHKKIIDKATFIKILELIQSLIWRRFIIGLPTNALNKIFMNLYEKVEKQNYLYSIQKSLLERTGTQRFPRNIETLDALKTKDLYNIKSKNRTYLLERLENHDNKERVLIEDNQVITVEHIFPQNPDSKWKFELGNEEYAFIKENYLNTISNLTLSGNNAKLGNKPFTEKRDLKGAGYKDSRLWLNKYLATLNKWGKAEIEKRFELISNRFLQIWEYPSITVTASSQNSEVNIFEAEEPKYKKLEYAIFLDDKFVVRKVAILYVEVFKKLFELQPERFFSSEIGSRIGLTKIEENLRQPLSINDTYYIEGNLDNNGKFDRIKYALTVFNLEDELSIKYEE